ncbi:hypothetical protein [Streptomyces halstedii]|uniref:Uncharacterized protein n=1 Tax=Streptomyces halstedii TaxID=1944 RepID=A0A6N9TV83_STRHA|nr:hypothetical protein [Streptomyces halstedii]NEA15411.1 hypothetical protein [Streptomyces halstedii]
MPFTAEAALTDDEVCALNALPGADFEVDTEPLGCDFGAHGSEAEHTVCAQMQYEPGGLVLWWLFWDDEGRRELRIAPGCKKVVVSEACLLVEDHPGTRDQSIGPTREELAAEFPWPGAASG